MDNVKEACKSGSNEKGNGSVRYKDTKKKSFQKINSDSSHI